MNTLLLQAASENPLMQMVPFVLMIVVVFFFMIRPQMKKSKEARTFREALKKGDPVLTISGVHGKVYEMREETILMEIAPNVRITVQKSGLIANASSMAPQR